MTGPCIIPDDAIFDDEGLCRLFGLRPGSLDRARRTGALKHTKRGGKAFYTGAAVREWLTRDETPAEAREAVPC